MSRETDLSTLRKAAEAIREEWGEVRGTGWTAVQGFYLAVADLLDAEAATQAGLEPAADLINVVIKNAGGPIGYIKLAKKPDGQPRFSTDTTPASLRVAETFLRGKS